MKTKYLSVFMKRSGVTTGACLVPFVCHEETTNKPLVLSRVCQRSLVGMLSLLQLSTAQQV